MVYAEEQNRKRAREEKRKVLSSHLSPELAGTDEAEERSRVK